MKKAIQLPVHLLPPPGGKVLVALSGGADSVCLLHLTLAAAKRRGFAVEAAHYNHALRGAESDRDEAFVRKLCRELNVPCRVGRGHVLRRAEERGESVEEAARAARYAFLSETARAAGVDVVATAHTQNDNAETVLFNLLRGSGTLRGIPERRGVFVRPLLGVSREAIEAYLTENHLPHVEDSTNALDRYSRNRLRHRVLPVLQELNAAAAANIARAAAIAGAESDYLDALAKERMAALRAKEGEAALPLAHLLAAPEVLRPRMARLLLNATGAGKKDVTYSHVESILRLKEGDMTALPGLTARVEKGEVILSTKKSNPPPLTLSPGQKGEWNGERYALVPGEETARGLVFTVPKGETVTLRTWQRADRIALPGFRGSRSLKRVFADLGVPAWERERCPVIVSGGVIRAVWGVGINEEAAGGENTLTVEIKKDKKD